MVSSPEAGSHSNTEAMSLWLPGEVENCTHCPFPSARGHPVETQHSVNQVHATHVGAELSNCQWPRHLDKTFVFLGPSSAAGLLSNHLWQEVQESFVWLPSLMLLLLSFWRACPLWSCGPLEPCYSWGFLNLLLNPLRFWEWFPFFSFEKKKNRTKWSK